jgi:hypothetical protein
MINIPKSDRATRIALQKLSAKIFKGLTINGLLYYEDGRVKSLGEATDGQLPIGDTDSAPILATLTATANQTSITNGAGSITIGTVQDIATSSTPEFAGLGIGEPSPLTLVELTSTAPYLTLHNTTEEDGEGGREGKLSFRGEQSGGEESELAYIEGSHIGTSDDARGQLKFYTNSGEGGPALALKIKDDGDVHFYGSILMPASGIINYRDAGLGMVSWADTYLDIFADGAVRIGDSSSSAPTNYTQLAADGTITFNGTARINWTKVTANGATLTNFTSADSVSDLQTANDGNTYTCTEVAGGNNHLVVDFTSVNAFNWLRCLAYYDGNSVHNVVVQLEITPFDGSTWHTLDSIAHQTAATNTMEDHSFFIPDDAAYINSGTVKVRFLHSAATTAGHTLVIDECSLYQ